MTTYTTNKEHNGIEIRFDNKPAEEIRAKLKENGFRWHRKKAVWYAKNTPERLTLAENIGAIEAAYKYADEIKEEERPASGYGNKKQANKYGVKVGDIFYASWGYEQTNVDFFQVVALAGSSSVRVVEVNPPIIDQAPTCSMAGDFTYKITGEMLEPVSSSIFIKDQAKGDIKRLKSYAADGVSNPQFKISSYADAYKVEGEEITQYVSWYA